MSAVTQTVYLADANVLLNLRQLGRLDVLALSVSTLGWRIIVPRCIFAEVSTEVSEQDLASCGVLLAEDDPDVAEALILARRDDGIPSRVSDADAELYVRAKDGKGIVWTDDAPLFRFLGRVGVPFIHTFAPFLELCKRGELTMEEVLECGRQLTEINPRFTEDNLADLKKKLEAC